MVLCLRGEIMISKPGSEAPQPMNLAVWETKDAITIANCLDQFIPVKLSQVYEYFLPALTTIWSPTLQIVPCNIARNQERLL